MEFDYYNKMKFLLGSRLTLGRTRRVGGGGRCYTLHKVFEIFQKTIYFKGLEISAAVHSSPVEVVICQFWAVIFDVAMAATNFV